MRLEKNVVISFNYLKFFIILRRRRQGYYIIPRSKFDGSNTRCAAQKNEVSITDFFRK